MRLSDKHLKIIEEVESDGYVWLSHLSKNAIERFRYKTKHGFSGYMKIEGLTFLTKRVAESIARGCRDGSRRRLTYKEQNELLEKDLVALERELYQAKKVGERKIKRRYKDVW